LGGLDTPAGVTARPLLGWAGDAATVVDGAAWVAVGAVAITSVGAAVGVVGAWPPHAATTTIKPINNKILSFDIMLPFCQSWGQL
jgi:uncharacterized membrane protein